MLDTSTRLLRLLTLLQTRRDWPGPGLADRLGVSTRTVRHDMARLRALGYPVEAAPGVAGGYRLGSGGTLPPLLLDDEEAVAVAVGLRSAAGAGVAGVEDSALRALIKLEQVLPGRLRSRVNALQAYTVAVARGGPAADPQVLARLAAACRDREVVSVDYTKHDGAESARALEPYRLVHWSTRWYLVAWDRERSGWRTFRVDRLRLRSAHGPHFSPREPPAEDVAAYVRRGIRTARARFEARVVVRAPAEVIVARVPSEVVVEALDAESCAVYGVAATPLMLAMHLSFLDAEFEVTDPPELVEALRVLARRFAAATGR